MTEREGYEPPEETKPEQKSEAGAEVFNKAWNFINRPEIEMAAVRARLAAGELNTEEEKEYTALAREDKQMILAESLALDQTEFTAERQERGKKYGKYGHEIGLTTLKLITGLRQRILEHNENLSEVVGEIHAKIKGAIEKLRKEVEVLGKQPPAEIIKATVAKKRENLAQATKQQEAIENIIQTGYGELWEKIKLQALTHEDAGGEPFLENTPPVEAGAAIITEANETRESGQNEAEAARFLKLETAITRMLPQQYKQLAPDIMSALVKCGFNFTERDNRIVKNGRSQDTVHYALFIDPARPDLPEAMAELQAATYETIGKHLKKMLERISAAAAVESPVKKAMFNLFSNGRWDYADIRDAESILQYLHATNPAKAYAMYMKEVPDTGESLSHISATTGAIGHKPVANRKDTPKYGADKTTIFFSSPTFVFDINK